MVETTAQAKVKAQLERELKFDVPLQFRLPGDDALTAVAGKGTAARSSTVRLASTYYDTAERALLRQRITLRRREGDDDTGWHLKVPAGEARTELRLPLDDSGDDDHGDVPTQLRELVAGLTLGAPLRPVATVRTERRRTGLYAGDELLAEIADDEVHGAAIASPAQLSEWREVEVELGSGDERLLAKLAKALLAAGARPSESRSKVARALGAEHPVEQARDESTRVLAGYLGAQFATMSAGDLALRRGLEPVHATRVAVRRMRSTLRVFAAAMVDDVQELEPELSWYQDQLGAVRDRQVQRERLAAAVAALPPELVLGPVSSDIDTALLREQLDARDRLREVLDSERYRLLMLRVRSLADDPPTRPGIAVADLMRMAGDADDTATRRLRHGIKAVDADLLHRARKAAKRARYAAEAVEPAVGKRAARRIARLTAVQDTLGEHQDSALSAAYLRRFGASFGAAAERNGFTYGLLYEREQRAQALALQEALHLRR